MTTSRAAKHTRYGNVVEVVTEATAVEKTADQLTEEATKLRPIRQKYAAEAAKAFGMIKAGMEALMEIEEKITTESIGLVGERFDDHHIVGFRLFGTNAEQIEEANAVQYPDFDSVLFMSAEGEKEALAVIGAEDPMLPSE